MCQTKLIYGTLQRRGTCEKQGLCFCWIVRSSSLERSVDKFSLIQWKTPVEFVFEFRYVIIDQLYDKFSITKPIKLDIIDRLQNERFFSTNVCFVGFVFLLDMAKLREELEFGKKSQKMEIGNPLSLVHWKISHFISREWSSNYRRDEDIQIERRS